MSANRRRVLECILNNDVPVSAYAILARLRAENPKAAPLLVYRALSFLFDRGLIDRIELLNAYLSRPNLEPDRRRMFLVCDGCGRVEAIEDAAVGETLRRVARERGFQVEGEVVELSGRCKDCAVRAHR